MTRQEFMEKFNSKGIILEEEAIYVDNCIEHPNALGMYEEDGKFIVYVVDESDCEEEFTFDNEEDALEELFQQILARPLPEGYDGNLLKL